MTRSQQEPPQKACVAGERWNVVGGLIICRISGSAAAQSFSVVEVHTPPGGGTPLHVHRSEDEVFHIVEGEFEVIVGGRATRLGPGDVAAGLRGVPHSYRNVGSQPGRMLVTIIPAGFENFFREVHERGDHELNPQALAELGQRYGLEFV